LEISKIIESSSAELSYYFGVLINHLPSCFTKSTSSTDFLSGFGDPSFGMKLLIYSSLTLAVSSLMFE